jgi:hypothetical protein
VQIKAQQQQWDSKQSHHLAFAIEAVGADVRIADEVEMTETIQLASKPTQEIPEPSKLIDELLIQLSIKIGACDPTRW